MARKHKEPLLDGMIHVDSESTRKKLIKKYGFEIPSDVEYILPPEGVNELLNNPESWEEDKK